MTRFTAPFIAILLCGTALTGCASDGGAVANMLTARKGAPDSDKAAQSADAAAIAANALAPMDIESGVRQAQTQRLTGHYDDAIHTLSQLMLVASDDPRVVGEYGKALTEKGRAQDAVQFLTRATELQPNEWSFYSALGVAYDQVGDQSAARMAYERALKLNPNEASVLNNYALSRMLANDPDTARQLIARAQTAGGTSDPKIARNIDLVNKLAPASKPVEEQKDAATEPQQPAPVSAPMPVNSSPLPPASTGAQNVPAAQPHAPAAAPKAVMQAVPADPLAGPVKAASHEPKPLAEHAAVQTNTPAAKPDVKDAHLAGEKVATHEPTPLVSHATVPANAPAAKVDAKDAHATDAKVAAAGKSEPLKADGKADAKIAAKGSAAPVVPGVPALKVDTRTATAKPEAVPVKAADAKSVPVKADAKDAKAPAKPASKAIPALRQTASVY
jgi:Flp pilus assembly protein TadD